MKDAGLVGCDAALLSMLFLGLQRNVPPSISCIPGP
jgi:hypothetical protein